METASSLIDFALSLSYAARGIEEHKEYRDLVKVVDPQYLEYVMHYQDFLQTRKHSIIDWATDEYNVAHYLILDKEISSFEDFAQSVETLTKDEAFELVNTYALENTQKKFSVQALIDSPLSETNRWRLTQLYYDFDDSKTTFLHTLTDLRSKYMQLTHTLEAQFSRKISQETAHLYNNPDEIYSTVFADYVSREDFNSADEKVLLLAAFPLVTFIHTGKKSIGLGLYAFDYFNLLRNANNYSQEFREKILKALADPTRFGILKLINEGITSNKIIAQKFGISSAAVTYQLKYLLDNQILIADAHSKKPILNKKLLKAVLTGVEKELFLDE